VTLYFTRNASKTAGRLASRAVASDTAAWDARMSSASPERSTLPKDGASSSRTT
jgi:hypothetical protein